MVTFLIDWKIWEVEKNQTITAWVKANNNLYSSSGRCTGVLDRFNTVDHQKLRNYN